MEHAEVSRCGDCKQPQPKLFMVQDDLWVWHIGGPELLCLRCAEHRLGRPFQEADFKLGPANHWVFEAFDSGSRPAAFP